MIVSLSLWTRVEEWRPNIFWWGTLIPYLKGLGGKSRPAREESHMLGSQGKGASVQPCLLNHHRVCTAILVLLCGVGVQGTVPPAPTPQGARDIWVSRDLIGCPIWGKECCWHLVVEARNAAQHPTMHRMAPREFLRPRMSAVLLLRTPALLPIKTPVSLLSAAGRRCLGIR